MGLVVEINDTKKVCPICWEETTTEEYQGVKAVRELDLLTAFCGLNSLPFAEVAETSSDEIDSVLYQCASFVFNQEEYFRDLKPPTHYKLGGKTVMVPTKLGSLTIMQNLIIRQAMSKPNTCLEQLISIAVAVFLQPLVDEGKFSYDRAKELEKEVLKMPIEKTFPVGFFYLSKLNNFGRFGLLAWFQNKLRKLNFKMRLPKLLALTGLISLASYQSLNSLQLRSDNSQGLLSKNHSMMLYQCFGFGKNVTSIERGTEYRTNHLDQIQLMTV